MGSRCGFGLSVLIYATMLAFGLSRLQIFVFRMLPQISAYTKYDERKIDEVINLADDDFMVAFTVEKYFGSVTSKIDDEDNVEFAVFFEETHGDLHY